MRRRAETSLAMRRYHAARGDRQVGDLKPAGILLDRWGGLQAGGADGLRHARLAVHTFARQLRRYTRPTRDPAPGKVRGAFERCICRR